MQLKPITAIIVLFIVVASLLVTGCTTSPSTSTSTPTTEATANPTAVATVKATSAPQNITTQIDSYFKSQGYSITKSATYNKTNLAGDSVYKGTVTKGGDSSLIDVTVSYDSSAAAKDLSLSVRAAESLGWTGSYESATHWTGTTDTGLPVVLWTTGDNWSIMMVG